MKSARIVIAFAATLSIIAAGCQGGEATTSGVASSSAGSSSGSSGASTTTTTTVNLSSCNTVTVDSGAKGTASGTLRGQYSDVRIMPGTSYPAIAYVDPYSLVIKYAYWTGSAYSIEAIAGDNLAGSGGVNSIRLAFKSTGEPIVAWTTGSTAVKVAIRSATSASSGTWTADVVETITGGTTSSINLQVNPNNQFALSDITSSGGFTRFAYCDAPCSTPANFQVMAAGAAIDLVTSAVGRVETGLGWCRSGSNYYPAVAYDYSTSIRYAVCNNATLSNCLTGANWQKVQVAATGRVASTGGGVRMQLDPYVNLASPNILARTAIGLVPVRYAGTCDTTTGVFAAGPILPGSNAGSGTASMTLTRRAASGTGTFQVIANDTTTGVRYWNNAVATDVGSGWYAYGSFISNLGTPLPAANLWNGGADVATTTDILYTTYDLNTSPVFNLALGIVSNVTDVSNTAALSTTYPDTTGQVDVTTGQYRNTAIAATAAGRPGVALVNYDIGSTGGGTKLKYGLRSGTASTDGYVLYTVPGTTSPQFPSLAYDVNNKPWISYYEASTFQFYLVTNSSSDGSGSWSSYQFPVSPTGSAIIPAENGTALAMYHASASSSFPVMAILDHADTSSGVRTARFNPSTTTWSAVQNITSFNAAATTGASISIDANSNYGMALVWYDPSLTRAKYTYDTGSGTTFNTSPFTVTSLGTGQGITVKINPSNGRPAISYYDRANNRVYYAPSSTTLAGSVVGGWAASAVELAAGISGLASVNEGLLQAALSFTTAGLAYIMYPAGPGTYGSLMRTTNATGSFVAATLRSGANGAINGAAAGNYGVAGWKASAVRTSLGTIATIHTGPGNKLEVTSCGD